MNFVVRGATCMICKVVIRGVPDTREAQFAICSACRGSGKHVDLQRRKAVEMADLEECVSSMVSQCQKCVGDYTTETISCENDQCDIFYQRVTRRVEMESARGAMSALKLE